MEASNGTVSPVTGGLILQDREVPAWLQYFVICFLSTVSLVTITGNGLVCLIICKRQEMRTITGYFLLNLAISDFSVGITAAPTGIAAFFDQALLDNQIVCKFNGFTLVLFFMTSIITLTAISIHKWISVTFPLENYISKRRCVYIIITVWTISLVLALGPVFGWNGYYHFRGRHQCTVRAPANLSEIIYMFLLLALGYLIPVPTMVVCYVWTYIKTKNHLERMKARSLSDRSFTKSEAHIINTMVIVLVTFILCWLPFCVYTCYGFLHREIPYYLPIVAFMFGYGNSALNPIIYALRHESFRKGFMNLLSLDIGSRSRQGPSSFHLHDVSVKDFSPDVPSHLWVAYQPSYPIAPPYAHPTGQHVIMNGHADMESPQTVCENGYNRKQNTFAVVIENEQVLDTADSSGLTPTDLTKENLPKVHEQRPRTETASIGNVKDEKGSAPLSSSPVRPRKASKDVLETKYQKNLKGNRKYSRQKKVSVVTGPSELIPQKQTYTLRHIFYDPQGAEVRRYRNKLQSLSDMNKDEIPVGDFELLRVHEKRHDTLERINLDSDSEEQDLGSQHGSEDNVLPLHKLHIIRSVESIYDLLLKVRTQAYLTEEGDNPSIICAFHSTKWTDRSYDSMGSLLSEKVTKSSQYKKVDMTDLPSHVNVYVHSVL